MDVASLPIELFIDIARFDSWIMSGALARCCKEALRLFLDPRILREIVTFIKHIKGRLFKWLVFALPSKYFITPMVAESAQRVIGCVEIPHSLVFGTALFPTTDNDRFFSGGRVCQAVYQQKWKCDIDVYVNDHVTETRRYIRGLGEFLDIIPTARRLHMERVIQKFDISIVQQGYRGNEYYLTPLSLYTLYTSDIIAKPTIDNIIYHLPTFADGKYFETTVTTRDIWHYVQVHEEKHKNSEFHVCTECHTQNISEIVEWRKRIEKYKARFPSFTISYCEPPFSY